MMVDADEREYFQIAQMEEINDATMVVSRHRQCQYYRSRWLWIALVVLILMGVVTSTVAVRRSDATMWNDQTYTTESFFLHTARCFSCMSKFYEAVWPALSHVYKRPRNFTDSCNEEQFDPNAVPVTHCSTICVQMWEEPTVAGVKIRGYIRGCLDDILHHGFNQSIVAWYRWLKRDSCHAYSKRDLFMLPHEQSDNSLVNVCTCYADYCNAAGGASATTRVFTGCLMALFGRFFLHVLSRLV